MTRRFTRQRYPREVAERLRLAAARARGQILEQHVASALDLVEEGGRHVPVDRLLAAYGRLQGLDEGDQRQLGERVLAALGNEAGNEWSQRELTAPRSPWRRLVQRLRGRVHHEFRAWLERHTARVQLDLIDLHVRHALEYVRITDGHLTPSRAIDAYCRELQLRTTTGEIVGLMALRSLDTRQRMGQVEPLHPDAPTPPLRIADGGS